MPVNRAIELSVRIGCPVRCQYCPQNVLIKANKNNEKVLTTNNLKIILDNASQKTPLDVFFAGFTEPFAVTHWVDLFNLCENHQHVNKIVVFTTGWKLNEQDISQFPNFKKLTNFNFHVTTNGLMHFDLNLKLLPIIKKYLPQTTFIGVGFNYDDFQNIIDELNQHHLKFMFQPIISRSGNVTQVKQTPLNINKIKRPVTCIKTNEARKPVVLPDGKTLVCCNDYGCELPIGNLLEQTWDKLDFDRIVKLQNEPSDLPCFRDCHFARIQHKKIPL